jgi:membrane protease YdiL (CAAX protease family)
MRLIKRADGSYSLTMETVPTITNAKVQSTLRVVNGLVFVLLMVGAMSIPPFRRWPWIWSAPLSGYFLMAVLIPRLRSSMTWLRLGKVSGASIAATLGIMVMTSVALVAFNRVAKADPSSYRVVPSFEMFGGVIVWGVVFTVVNATLEELVFRGVLFDAVRSQWNVWVTVVGTSLLFGLGHLHGYPPGLWGACLAVAFGFAVGVLRVWTGGLGLPIVAHMGADATIYCILVRWGVV